MEHGIRVALLALIFLSGCGEERGVPADELLGRSWEAIPGYPEGGNGDRLGVAGRCIRIRQNRYMDAYTSGNGDVVTRAYQNSSTQHWCFSIVSPNSYTIQHRSFSGQYLDAYETLNGHKAVLRDWQNNGSQIWIPHFFAIGDPVWFRQESTGRFLQATTTSATDYRVVTAPGSETSLQQWFVEGTL
jgi:hypothetical protein